MLGVLADSADAEQRQQHDDDEQHEEQDEKNLRDTGRASGDAGKTKDARQEGNHCEDQGPLQHFVFLAGWLPVGALNSASLSMKRLYEPGLSVHIGVTRLRL